LPPIWGIKHQINLVPRAFILNRLAYKSDPNEIKKLQWQVGELNDKRVHKKKKHESMCNSNIISTKKG
jgi:hypothetical protein